MSDKSYRIYVHSHAHVASYTGNNDYHSSVSAMLQDLDWPTLQYHQIITVLQTLHNLIALHGNIATTLLHSQQPCIYPDYIYTMH